ncbi:hypothetical protein [Streptomyces sp. NPDC090022]|uniref:hypothetical protein n=1 Tax=Streptomyces sp. NPDC090022 TaxID=3365920 RepID=UPI00380901B3
MDLRVPQGREEGQLIVDRQGDLVVEEVCRRDAEEVGQPFSLPQRLSRDLTESMGGTVRTTVTASAFAVDLTLPAARRH